MRSGMIVGLVVALLAGGSALAQDNALYFSPALSSELTAPSAFDGLYAGVLTGPISARKNNFNTQGWEIRPEVGGVVGWNQPIAKGVVLGGELQATVATDFSTAYLRLMARHKLVFQLDASAVPGQVAGDQRGPLRDRHCAEVRDLHGPAHQRVVGPRHGVR